MAFIFVSENLVEDIKQQIKKENGYWKKVKWELKLKAEELMTEGPWSVTFNISSVVSGNPHDYFSEGTYWWPDPNNPNGPYIRRDGEFNPERFTKHYDDMMKMSYAVMYLSSAGYYLDERKYIDRAIYLLEVWFLDEKTKMNPHLEYSQAIKGICDGRSIGIIDTVALLPMIHGLGFIEKYKEYNAKIQELKNWFREYVHWLTTSPKGIQEKYHGNNHSNWWNTQVAAFSAFIGNEDLVRESFEFFEEVIVPNQLNSDGSFKDEITRTNSMFYSFYNLDASALLCEIAYNRGIDLWHYKTADGKGIESAVKFLIPYFDNPFTWPYKEIDGQIPDENYSFQMAAIRLGLKECLKINFKRGKDKYLIRDQAPIGPLVLLRS